MPKGRIENGYCKALKQPEEAKVKDTENGTKTALITNSFKTENIMSNWTKYASDYEKEPCYIRYDDGKEK